MYFLAQCMLLFHRTTTSWKYVLLSWFFHICNLKYEIVPTELNLLENGAPTNLNRATIRLAAIEISPIEKILLHIPVSNQLPRITQIWKKYSINVFLDFYN